MRKRKVWVRIPHFRPPLLGEGCTLRSSKKNSAASRHGAMVSVPKVIPAVCVPISVIVSHPYFPHTPRKGPLLFGVRIEQ